MLAQGVEYIACSDAHQLAIEDRLQRVDDPEIGIDIVNLGLVYQVKMDETATCWIEMTLTSIGCDCQEQIAVDIERELMDLDFVDRVQLRFVFEPQWNMNRITRIGRISLGINPN